MRETLREKRGSGGFTLVELLITIVIVGILAAVVVLAIGGLTDTGESAACKATEDAAHAASIAYYSDQNAWPASFTDLSPAYLTLRSGTNLAAGTPSMGITAAGWTLNFPASVGANGPVFTGCPA
jgi:general secretion pathway protein G